ncbi:MAG: hypothetical protein IGS48_08740 [Oscillatoriales cyanobacterium C42_A2020_001]|nr:hypothetical protein [Leptolyngbyaceae cyanobacterium C42_A2020_001]
MVKNRALASMPGKVRRLSTGRRHEAQGIIEETDWDVDAAVFEEVARTDEE